MPLWCVTCVLAHTEIRWSTSGIASIVNGQPDLVRRKDALGSSEMRNGFPFFICVTPLLKNGRNYEKRKANMPSEAISQGL
jgi:hypothetical protein